MSRWLAAITLASASLFALAPTVALAASPSEEECIASGGTFDRSNGTVTCTVTEHLGASDQTKTEETGGQGNTGNKTTNCTNGPGEGGGNKTC